MRTTSVDLLVLLPLAGALLVLAAGRGPLARWLALGASVAVVVPLASVWRAVASGETARGAGGFWSLTVDGLSLPLVALTAFVGIIAIAASWNVAKRPRTFFALLLLLQAAVTAVFVAADVVLFYVAWEAVLVPLFFLIGGWGHANAPHAAVKFFLFTFTGSVFMLAGLLMAAVAAESTAIADLAGALSGTPFETFAFWFIMLGLLVKLPAFPLHTWLPDAHTEAPTAGSIVLAGVVLKLGGYGVLRIALPLAPDAFSSAAPILAALGIIGIVYGAAMAFVQTDLKRLVAYSSISHMGFVLLAEAAATPDAFGAALLVMVSHGLVTTMLFFLVGALSDRAHTRSIAAFGGLGRTAPLWGTAFTFAALASLGLPGLSGFPGEFVSVLTSWGAFGVWTVVAILGVILAAAYNLRAVRRSVQGPVGPASDVVDLDGRERAIAVVLASSIVVLGLAPMLVVGPARSALVLLASLLGGGR